MWPHEYQAMLAEEETKKSGKNIPDLVEGLMEQTRKDIRAAAQNLGEGEARYLVDYYYQMQGFRTASSNMVRAMTALDEPSVMVGWLSDSHKALEARIRVALEAYAKQHPVGQWMLSIHGIGPVIAAGLLAHIDIAKAPYAGNIWNFAGLNPKSEWRKGEKRPWNAKLKVLCWKIGDSFVKSSGSEKSVYGKIYRKRKELEVQRNEEGLFADQAADKLAKFKIQDKATRAMYESGKLPAGRVDQRARRIAVKLFLSHMHDVWTWHVTGHRAPPPYAIQHMGHHNEIQCPNAPWDKADEPE